jgi:hypothetical protein
MNVRIPLALVGLLVAGSASAASFVFPRNGLSAVDEAFVLYTDSCGQPDTDPMRAPEIHRDLSQITVDIYLAEPESPVVCIATFAPPVLKRVSLGRLTKGFYSVRMREYVRPFASTVYTLRDESFEGFEVRNTPNPDISGTWYDPTAAGTGLVINLVPSPGLLDPRAFVILATVNAAGQPVWYSGVGVFVDARLEVSLTLGGATAPAGVGVFEYDGCGRAHFRVDNLALRFPAGRASLQQLTQTVGVSACTPPLFEPAGWR